MRAASTGAVLAALLLGTAATPAAAARTGDDLQLAKAGTLAVSDLPAGFATKPDTGSSKAANIRLAKGISGCAPYIALQKTLIDLPSARSASLEDQTRKVGNEVDVFKSDRAASATRSRCTPSPAWSGVSRRCSRRASARTRPGPAPSTTSS